MTRQTTSEPADAPATAAEAHLETFRRLFRGSVAECARGGRTAPGGSRVLFPYAKRRPKLLVPATPRPGGGAGDAEVQLPTRGGGR